MLVKDWREKSWNKWFVSPTVTRMIVINQKHKHEVLVTVLDDSAPSQSEISQQSGRKTTEMTFFWTRSTKSYVGIFFNPFNRASCTGMHKHTGTSRKHQHTLKTWLCLFIIHKLCFAKANRIKENREFYKEFFKSKGRIKRVSEIEIIETVYRRSFQLFMLWFLLFACLLTVGIFLTYLARCEHNMWP